MSIRSKQELFESIKPLAETNGVFDTLGSCIGTLTDVFTRNSKLLGLSQDQENRLIGHQGVNGEYGNGVGFFFMSFVKHEFQKMGDQRDEAKVLKGVTRFCHFFFEHHSQLSKSHLADKSADEHKETAHQALERSAREIETWLDENAEKLSTKDIALLQTALSQFNDARKQFTEFAVEAKQFLEHNGEQTKFGPQFKL